MGRKGGGMGTTLVLALVIVVLGVALGVGLARFGGALPLVGPLLGEKLLVIATGNVEAGVDLGDIKRDDVSVEGDTVTIDLPEAEILSASLDEEKTSLYDRDLSPLNLRPDDALVEEARLRAVGKISASARENGILDTAEGNAEDSIRAFVITLGFEKVKFR